jgi:two-component system, response regulator RegA
MTATLTETAKLKIMVVDDDSTFRDRLVAALGARNFNATGSSSPAEGLELAKKFMPDRAVVDLRMPGGSGLDLVSDLMNINPEIDIVVLTGYGSIATALEATRRGAVDYLTKPADADQILTAFEKAGDKPLLPPPEGGHAEGQATQSPNHSAASLARVEWEHIQRVLTDCNNNISQAARVLRIHRRSLQRKLSKYPPVP